LITLMKIYREIGAVELSCKSMSEGTRTQMGMESVICKE
jgi:hypothetical protein